MSYAMNPNKFNSSFGEVNKKKEKDIFDSPLVPQSKGNRRNIAGFGIFNQVKGHAKRATTPEVKAMLEEIEQLPAPLEWEEEKPFSRETVEHAKKIVKEIAKQFEGDKSLIAPSIDRAPNGSIHFEWSFGDYDISVNVLGSVAKCVQNKLGSPPIMCALSDYECVKSVISHFRAYGQ